MTTNKRSQKERQKKKKHITKIYILLGRFAVFTRSLTSLFVYIFAQL